MPEMGEGIFERALRELDEQKARERAEAIADGRVDLARLSARARRLRRRLQLWQSAANN